MSIQDFNIFVTFIQHLEHNNIGYNKLKSVFKSDEHKAYIITDRIKNTTGEYTNKRIKIIQYNKYSNFKHVGVILSIADIGYKISSIRPVTYNINKDIKSIDNMDNIKIYPINDGTTVTLYYYNNKWVISTYNSWEMNDVKINNISYYDILNDVIKCYPDFSFDKLDKNKSYTIGFNHPSFHYYGIRERKPTMWLICSADIKAANNGIKIFNYDDSIGIPNQIESDDVKTSDIFYNTFNAYNNYKKNKNNINFGYVVRCDDILYIIDSHLMKIIKYLFYNIKYKIPSTVNRELYIVVNIYLNSLFNKYEDILLPRYCNEYKILSSIEEHLTESISNIILNKNQQKQNEQKQNEQKTIIYETSHNIYKNIIEMFKINLTNKNDIKNLINKIIVNTEYSIYFYNILIKFM